LLSLFHFHLHLLADVGFPFYYLALRALLEGNEVLRSGYRGIASCWHGYQIVIVDGQPDPELCLLPGDYRWKRCLCCIPFLYLNGYLIVYDLDDAG
jgi:hypothetical protein